MGNLTDLSVNMDFGTHSGQESLVLFVRLFRLAVTSAELQQPYKLLRIFINMRGEIKGMECPTSVVFLKSCMCKQ